MGVGFIATCFHIAEKLAERKEKQYKRVRYLMALGSICFRKKNEGKTLFRFERSYVSIEKKISVITLAWHNSKEPNTSLLLSCISAASSHTVLKKLNELVNSLQCTFPSSCLLYVSSSDASIGTDSLGLFLSQFDQDN